MVHRARICQVMNARYVFLLAAFVGLQATTLQVVAAAAVTRPYATTIASLAALAAFAPRDCSAGKLVSVPAPGWQLASTQCAWQDRLQMRRWEVSPSIASANCVSKQALWWAWVRVGQTPAQAAPAWNAAWKFWPK